MTVKELFRDILYEDVWKKCVEINNFDEESSPLAKERHKKVFDFVKDYSGIKSEYEMIVCLIRLTNDYDIGVSGILTDSITKEELDNTKLLKEEKVWKMERYALECSEFYEWADWIVSECSIDTYGKVRCASEILWEMTYHGTTNEERQERLKNIL